jgi:hypothetical protein
MTTNVNDIQRIHIIEMEGQAFENDTSSEALAQTTYVEISNG